MADGHRRKSRLLAFRRLIDEKLEQRVATFDQNAADTQQSLWLPAEPPANPATSVTA